MRRPSRPILLCCLLTFACEGEPSTPAADGCQFAADPSSCWRALAGSILDCMAGLSEATLSSDAASCSWFNGPYAKFDSPVPIGIEPVVVGVTIGTGSRQCVRIERNRGAGSLIVTGPDGRSVREDFDEESGTSSVTCPDRTVHVVTGQEVMEECFADAMSGGLPAVLVSRDSEAVTVALSGYDTPLIVCR